MSRLTISVELSKRVLDTWSRIDVQLRARTVLRLGSQQLAGNAALEVQAAPNQKRPTGNRPDAMSLRARNENAI